MTCLVLWMENRAESKAENSACVISVPLTLLVGARKSIRPVKNWVNEVLEWLSLWSKVQMICLWSSWCHCHPIISCFIKIQIGLTFLLPAYWSCPGKETIKWATASYIHPSVLTENSFVIHIYYLFLNKTLNYRITYCLHQVLIHLLAFSSRRTQTSQ